MSLLDKKSMYDRHTHGDNSTAVAQGFTGENFASSGPSPANGIYFANGNSGWQQSPFISSTGDHMVDLMTENITSENHSYGGGTITYFKSPTNSPFQDLNTPADPLTYSGQQTNALLGQFGGPYIDNCPPGGFC
jgi:hypothetical protein